jgi:multiple sugar transport system permease protein
MAFRPLVAHPPEWLQSTTWALPAFILMSLWGIGGARMIIFLAGLQGISDEYYEAARIDGAGSIQQFRHITIPLLTPTIFFNLVLGVIGAFQVFTAAYIMTGGGPNNATLFYVLYLYRHAFEQFHMGYASALAWVLFIILFAITMLQFKRSSRWVHYEGENR